VACIRNPLSLSASIHVPFNTPPRNSPEAADLTAVQFAARGEPVNRICRHLQHVSNLLDRQGFRWFGHLHLLNLSLGHAATSEQTGYRRNKAVYLGKSTSAVSRVYLAVIGL
jgi:hypothetical protein